MLLLTLLLIVYQISNYGQTEAAVGGLDASDLLPDDCGPINGKSNGTQGPVYEYPWMAIIAYKNGYNTRYERLGTIINCRYILTTAYFVVGKEITSVRVGEHNIRSLANCQDSYCQSPPNAYVVQDIGVAAKIVHESFNKNVYPWFYNIALLRLERDIDFSYPNVDKICLPNVVEGNNYNVEPTPIGAITSWGYFHSRHPGDGSPWPRSDVLRRVDIPAISPQECHMLWAQSNIIDSNEFCAYTPGLDSCLFDDGAPYIVQGEYNCAPRYIQYGFVVKGSQNCAIIKPIMFTDVRKYMNWIISHMTL